MLPSSLISCVYSYAIVCTCYKWCGRGMGVSCRRYSSWMSGS